jgi:hypothetical protein
MTAPGGPDLSGWKLRRLPVSLRIAVAALALTLAVGEAASLLHVVHHHGRKDEEPGLSLLDLEGAYHGVDQPALLARSLDSPHVREHLREEKEREALRSWLSGSRVNQDYDDEDRLGELAPALVLERRCTSCHARNPEDGTGARGAAQALPLESWGDVQRVALARRLDPVPAEILVMSAHAHALTLPLVALAGGLLCLATSWPRSLVRGLVAAGAIGLLVDLSSWWLARRDFLPDALPIERRVFVKAIVAGGAVFAAALALELLLVLADLCLPGPRPAPGGGAAHAPPRSPGKIV